MGGSRDRKHSRAVDIHARTCILERLRGAKLIRAARYLRLQVPIYAISKSPAVLDVPH